MPAESRWVCRAAAGFAVALACVTSMKASAEVAPVGGINKVEGDASAVQGSSTRGLVFKAPVFFKDRLRTGAGGRLEAKLDDGTVLTLGEKGKLTIDEFVYNPGAGGGKLALNVQNGAFLFVGGHIEGATGGNVSIKTPVGTLGVRGTTVWGGHIDGGFGVLVLSGEVTVTTKKGTVTLQKGQGTMVYGGKEPTEAAPWPDDRAKRAVATVSFKN